jgi:hypothetical protein
MELHAVMMRFLNGYIPTVKDGSTLPITPGDIQEKMGELYDFLAIVRTKIHHDARAGYIDALPEPEFPTRIASTIGGLMEVHALISGRNEVREEDAAFGIRIVVDNIPTIRWQILQAMSTDWLTTSAIAGRADLRPGAIHYALDEMFALKLIETLGREDKTEGMDKRTDSHRLTENTARIVRQLTIGIRSECIVKDETPSDSNFYKQNNINNPIILKTNSYRHSSDQPTPIFSNASRLDDKNNIECGEEDGKSIQALQERTDDEEKKRAEHFKTPIASKVRQSASNPLNVLVRLNTDYGTDFPDPSDPKKFSEIQLHEGDEILLEYERAKSWKERGVASVVAVFLPLEAEA